MTGSAVPRFLYLARHGAADAFGEPTDDGRRQALLLGERLAGVPVTRIWHSPVARAGATAAALSGCLPGTPVQVAEELVDHVPYVPDPAQIPSGWRGFFDGYDPAEAAEGRRQAQALVDRFARPCSEPDAPAAGVHEVLITHAYSIAWLVREALAAPPLSWLSLTGSRNTGLTLIEYRVGLPPELVMLNDTSHLPPELRWTGFRAEGRP